MAKINPKALKNIFTEDIIDILPTNANIKRGVANAVNAQDPKWQEAHSKATSTDEYKQKVKEGRERFWASDTTEHRQHIAQSSFDAKISFTSKEQATEIFWLCWGPNRGEKLYKKLAKEYNVGYEGIINLVRGGIRDHAYCPVDDATLEKMKDEWTEKYQTYKVCAVIPGNTQLDNYDRLYKESSFYARANEVNRLATPSLVYYCRFVLENPTIQTVKEYCDSIGIPKTGNDNRQYKTILEEKFPWLCNEPSETIEFDSYEEMAAFLTTHKDNKGIRKVSRGLAWDYVKHKIQWKGNNFLGWMFYKKSV
jgi:hypothetical protein